MTAYIDIPTMKGGGSAYGGEWKPSKPDDERFLGEPGEVKQTFDRHGNARDTKIGSDGRAIRERHHTDHGSPGNHSVPHDHAISWNNNRPGWGNAENYWSGNVPEFKTLWRHNMEYTVNTCRNTLEDNRFKTISEFKWCMESGAEIEIEWKDIHYGIVRYGRDGRITIYVYNVPGTNQAFDSVDDALECRLGGDRLRDIITQVTVIDRTI